MDNTIEQTILEKIDQPGWTATRGVLRDPSGKGTPEEYAEVEKVMRDLASQGKVRLWRLFLESDGGVEVMAASRLDLELDKDLEERGAWARAEALEE